MAMTGSKDLVSFNIFGKLNPARKIQALSDGNRWFRRGLAAQEGFLRKHPVDDGGGVIAAIPGRHPIPHTGQRHGAVNPVGRLPGQIRRDFF